MASEFHNSDTLSAIEQLEDVLRNDYLRAEKLMSLRNPSHEELKAISDKIDKTFDELIEAMASANLGSNAIVAVTNNQHEFKSRKENWVLSRSTPSTASVSLSHIPAKSSKSHDSSSRSSKSSQHSTSSMRTLKHLEAKAKLKRAQLKAHYFDERTSEQLSLERAKERAKSEQLSLERAKERAKSEQLSLERAKERAKSEQLSLERKIAKREVSREIALAQAECEVYGSCDDATLSENEDSNPTVVTNHSIEGTNICAAQSIKVASLENSSFAITSTAASTESMSFGATSLPLTSILSTPPPPGFPPSTKSILNADAQNFTFTRMLSKQPPKQLSSFNRQWVSLPVESCSHDVPTQSTILPYPLSSILVQGPLPAQTTSSIESSQNYPIAQGPLPIQTMSKIGPVEGPSDPFIPSVAVQGPSPVNHTTTASLASGPSLVQPAQHVGSAEGSLPVCVSLSKDIVSPRVSPARCASFVSQHQGPRPSQFCVFTSSIQGSHGQSKTTYSSQVQSTCFSPTEHPTQSAGNTALYKPHTIYAPQTLTYVEQPQRFQPNFPRHDQQLDHVQPPTYSRPAQNQPPHSFVPPVNNSLQNPLPQSLYYPGVYNPDSVKYDNLFLPRPELPKFSGDPLDFKGFINSFETHIEPRVQDEKTLFCLLLQHCSKVVKDRIEHFATIEEHPYTTAKQRLIKEYGTPWIISDVCEQRLKVFPAIKSGDGEQLRRFAELLEKTQVIVEDIRHYTSLDSLDTLTDLVAKLPYDLKKKVG